MIRNEDRSNFNRRSLRRSRKKEGKNVDGRKRAESNESSEHVAKKKMKRNQRKSKPSAVSRNKLSKSQISCATMSNKDMQPEEYNGRFDLMYLSQLAEDTTAKETVHFIYENMVDFQSFLSSKPSPTKCFLVLKIAVKIKDTQLLQKRNSIYAKICDKTFLDNLIIVTSDLKSDKKSESSYREFINYINILLKHLMDNSQLQINVDLMNNVILASENIAKIVPSMADISKEIEKSKQKLLKSQDGIKQEPGSRENYRTVSLYPSAEDFEQTNFDSFKSLSRNIVEGSYKDVEHYLNVQFHLLREDFVCPLRAGIKSYKRLLDPSQRGPIEQDSSVHIYKGVKVLSTICGRGETDDISYRVQLDRNYCDEIRWEITKRLLFGSLVMFSNDDFKSFQLAVVSERDVISLSTGFLSVKFIGRDVYGSNFHRDQYVMAESDAFFEPVYQTLKTLQSIKCLPMEKYFLVQDVSPRRPSYISLGSVIQLGVHAVTLNNDSTWPDHSSLNMNESQYAALKASLRQEFAVIQGPPGTGKTFLALNIIEILLKNFQSVTPLLLLAYTNHALDSFLEGTLKFSKRVVRIGGQSQNKAINQYNLKSIKEQLLRNNRPRSKKLNSYTRTSESGEEEEVYVNWPKKFDSSLPVLKRELKQSYLEILVDTQVIRTIEDQLGLVNVPFFHRKMGVIDSTRIGSNDDFLVWLLGKSYKTVTNLIDEYIEIGEISSESQDKLDGDNNILKNLDFSNYPDNNNDLLKKVKNQMRSRVSVTFEEIDNLLTFLETCQDKESGISEKAVDNMILLVNIKANMKNGLDSCYYNIKSTTDDNPCIDDLWSLPSHERWQLYNNWVDQIRMNIMRELEAKKAEHAQRSSKLKDIRTKADLELLTALKPEIIGITTTGAARLHRLLSSLAPRIVVIEEAAQVLEAHIVSSLTKSCQHLILIGDHKQLRPSPSTYELAKMFDLDISLFERMVKNGVCCNTLNVQYRMKPNIATLISPTIYPKLTNDASVSNYPPVLGVLKNIFFIDHTRLEKRDLVSESRWNQHEAEFMIALCRYLILQGYQASDIVILTTYSRQQIILRELQKKEELLADVRMTVVDNYQGEECKIVLLSLVRSNREGNIGFLGAENRICVALSRAKHGLYIIGNMQLLKAKSTLWKQINATLQAQDAIGEELTLLCQVHDVETRVKSASDFKRMEHAECCRTREMCRVLLPCGHYCSPLSQTSHADHVGYKCLQPCNRKVCMMADDHPCPLPCYAPCTGCHVQVNRVLPQCGHIASMPCMKIPDEVPCTQKVNFKLSCGHIIENLVCSIIQQILKNDAIVCLMRCHKLLPCGHTCKDTCGHMTPCGPCKEMVNGVLCGDKDKLKEKRLNDKINMHTPGIFQQKQLPAEKHQEEQQGVLARQLVAGKHQEEQQGVLARQLAARKHQEERQGVLARQLVAGKHQEEQQGVLARQLAARKHQEEQQGVLARQLAAGKHQEEKQGVLARQLAAGTHQEEQQGVLALQLSARKRQQEQDQVLARELQERQKRLAEMVRHQEQLAARKRQEEQDQVLARELQERQKRLAEMVRHQEQLAARKRQEAQDQVLARELQEREKRLAEMVRHQEQLAARKRQEEQDQVLARQLQDQLAPKTRQCEQDPVLARDLQERQKRFAEMVRHQELAASTRQYEQVQEQHPVRPQQLHNRIIHGPRHSGRRKLILIIAALSLVIIIGIIFTCLIVYKLI